MLRPLALAVAMALAGTPSPTAHAQTVAGLVLVWTAPDGCPSQAAVEAEIDRLLGGPVASRRKRLFRVKAAVTHGALWQVVMDTSSDESNGHRTLEAATCDGLANATALIVALMIDPAAVEARGPSDTGKAQSEPRPSVASPASTPPAPPSPTPPSPTPPPARQTASANRFFLGAAAAGNLGVLPSPDLGAAGSVGVAGGRWRVELRAAYGPRDVRSDVLATAANAFGEFQARFLGTVSGCLTTLPSRTEWGSCLSIEGGVIRGRGVGASTTEEKSQPWLGLGAGGFFALRAGRYLAFPVHVDAIVPIWRPTYVFTNVPSPIFRPWPVGGRVTVSAEWRF